jgi:hypothetical protein
MIAVCSRERLLERPVGCRLAPRVCGYVIAQATDELEAGLIRVSAGVLQRILGSSW